MEKLLMLGTTGRGTKELLLEAKSRGLYTIITDNLTPEEAPLKKIADEYWMISTSEVDKLEELCKENGVTAIANGISTFNISITMELCKRLGLPCYATPEAWSYTMDKRAFKDVCIECGVPVAKDYFISTNPTEEELNSIEFPVVVKAIDQSANRGMSYCNKKEEILEACNNARAVSASETVIVERMLRGHEYTAWYALADGKASLMNFGIMLSKDGYPSNCYSITTTNSNHIDRYLDEVDENFKKVLNTIGCKEGIAWLEMMLDEDGHFYALEMGYRMSGDMMARVHKYAVGFDTYSWLIDVATGVAHSEKNLPVSQTKLPNRCGCSYILWSEDGGVISKVEGLEALDQLRNVHINVDGRLLPGMTVKKHQYLLVITFDTEDFSSMCETITYINQNVKIFTENGENIVIYYDNYDELIKIDNDARS